jgi:hypothetical protein
MKPVLTLIALGLAVHAGFGAEAKPKAKPYPLKTCVVSDEKFGGEMGDPYVFTHEGREVKLCCKGCLDDFKKDAAKYVKKMEAAEKKEAPKK